MFAKIKIGIKEILKKVADCLNEHWIWKTIILFLPSIYFPFFVKYYGVSLKLVDAKSKNELTSIGTRIAIALYVAVLGINILSNYKTKKDKEKDLEHEEMIQAFKNDIQVYQNTMGVYLRLMDVIGNICDDKFGSIRNYINDSLEKGTFNKPFNETIYPENQLKSIAKEMKLCISEMTNAPFNSISISMAYDFPVKKSAMYWIDQREVDSCMTLGQLKKNKETAFYKIYSEESNFLFFNDKSKAAKEHSYFFDKKDHKYRDIGSIICDEISIQDEEGKIARIILTISTYGHKFTDSEDEQVLENMSELIEEVILQQFEKRIKIELAFLFVKKQYNQK